MVTRNQTKKGNGDGVGPPNSPQHKKRKPPEKTPRYQLAKKTSPPASPSKNTRSKTDAGMGTPESSLIGTPQTINTNPGSTGDGGEAVLPDKTPPGATLNTLVTPAKRAPSVTPSKSPHNDEGSENCDASEESSVNKSPERDFLCQSHPSYNDGASFEELFPFVTDKAVSKTGTKASKATRKVFHDTHADFKEYMLGTKQNKMPLIEHKRANARIIIGRDGTSFIG